MTTTGNPYQSPCSTSVRDETPVGLEGSLAYTAIVLSSVFALLVLGTRGTLHERFEDFDADLPTLTQLIFSPAFAIIVVMLPALTVINHRMLRHKGLRMTWHTFVIVLVPALAALYAVALYLPTIQIGERLSYSGVAWALPT